MSDTGEFGQPGEATTPPVYPPPSYDPPVETIDLSTYDIPRLGCGEYQVSIVDRGGNNEICASDLFFLTGITFGRRLNEISEASVVISLRGSDPDCCECLADITPWKHELKIVRDTVEVWAGPVMGMTLNLNDNTLKITARDLMAYFDKRLFYAAADYEVEDVPITQVFSDLFDHGHNKDGWGLTLRITEVPILTSQYYPGYDTDIWGGRYPMIGDELRGLVDAGVDYTVINRDLFAGNVELSFDERYLALHGTARTRSILIDQSWAQLPEIEVVGTYMSNYTVVGGGFTGYYGWVFDQMWIEDAGVSGPGTEGVLETVHVSTSTEDVYTDEHPNPITEEAYARNQFNRNPYVVLTGGQLAPDAPFGYEALVPGLLIGLGITSCLTLDTVYRIHSITTEISADTEAVNIELAPVGAEHLRGT